jgi:hypothetical protein
MAFAPVGRAGYRAGTVTGAAGASRVRDECLYDAEDRCDQQ